MNNLTLKQLTSLILKQAEEKGFGTKPEDINVPEKIALIHSEVSEAFEAYRHKNIDGKDGFKEELGDTIQRILHLYAQDKDQNQPSFLLVSDPFADYINKFLKNSAQKEQNAYCQLLEAFEANKEFYNPFKLLTIAQKHIDDIGEHAYKKQILDFIKKASLFKPKMSDLRVEKVTYNTGYEVRYNCQYIRKENITILKSMILSIATFNNKKSAIPYLLKIINRSFSNANALRLGETSRSLGKLCIYTLAFQYDKEGKEELRKLYQEKTYKGIKSTILKYSKLNSENILE